MAGQLPAGVAAGHPATASVGVGILRSGGTAADAVSAMILAGSVAETLFTGLGGGGFATYYSAADQSVNCYDFFVTVPGLDGGTAGRGQPISVSFGGVAMPYEIGGPTVAVPGTPCGVEYLHRKHGQLDWSAIVEPAIELARTGTPFPVSHAELLPDVQAAMVLDAGISAYTVQRAGVQTLLAAQEILYHDGLATTLMNYRDGGAAALMTGEFGQELTATVQRDGGVLSMKDLASYQVLTTEPLIVPIGSHLLNLRGNDLDDVAGTFARYYAKQLPPLDDPSYQTSRAINLVQALAGPARRSDTTSVVAVDSWGNACAATHSLGLGSGLWVGGVHANSMLGEGELVRGPLTAGERMGSMMSPLIVTDQDGALVLAGGAAGGSRIRAALLQVVTGVLLQGMDSQSAVDNPRLSVAVDTSLTGQTSIHLEPGFKTEVLAALTDLGHRVNVWTARKPYFGGAAIVSTSGFAADPRRGGVAETLSGT